MFTNGLSFHRPADVPDHPVHIQAPQRPTFDRSNLRVLKMGMAHKSTLNKPYYDDDLNIYRSL